jgi:hypothetical protein
MGIKKSKTPLAPFPKTRNNGGPPKCRFIQSISYVKKIVSKKIIITFPLANILS